MFFNPEIVDEKYRQPIDELVDKVVQLCPIDVRRKLYSNIALSGGSTLFKGFKERLETGIQKRVSDRLKKYEQISKSKVINKINTVNPHRSESLGQSLSKVCGLARWINDGRHPWILKGLSH